VEVTISIIIVNYNVRYFLEQCLHSVAKAAASIDTEVIIIDNRSSDDSETYLCTRFPGLRYCYNHENVGFAKACNQGLTMAQGRYILFLNPDTLLREDSLRACLRFFETHPGTGAVGVRMIDGSGTFLPESKRAFPSPLTSLYKLFGLSRVFPRSRVFGRYHLGHLSQHENHEADVLAGAFMMIPREVLDKTGGFDEAFFMYGEDIDLSYRIQAAGYRNWYLADTTILHFKGESTKRGTLNYVRMFYSAMSIFVRKHYGGTRARLFRACIQAAIGIRAAVSASGKLLRKTGLPLLDALLILISFRLAREGWTWLVRPNVQFPETLIRFSLPAYALVYILTAYYAGLYDRIYRRGTLFRASAFAALVLIAFYALLPEHMRFSRGILVSGALLSFLSVGLLRSMLLRAGVLQRPVEQLRRPEVLVAGDEADFASALLLLQQNGRSGLVLGRLGTGGDPKPLARLEQAATAIRALDARALILCTGALSMAEILEQTEKLGRRVRLRYHARGSGSIIGSDSKDSSGETLSMEEPLQLALPAARRAKRLLDLLLSLGFLLTLPLHLLLQKQRNAFLLRCLQVLVARKTWVGYRLPAAALPPLRPGVLGPGGPMEAGIPEDSLRQADYWYARNYDTATDLKIIFKNYRWLGL